MTDKSPMKIGMVGLGRMGANMVRRLFRAGHQCRVHDVSEQAVKQLVGAGAEGAGSLADPRLDQFAGRVADSGEGRWTSIAAIEEGVPATLLTAALYSRFASRGSAVFAGKVQSAQRLEFGGHAERREPS
jgi:6-phosphogluconate dehydrogenase (decarboxylating)